MQTKILVWRIENSCHRGIYQFINTIAKTNEYYSQNSLHPAPFNDSMFASNANKLGFTSGPWSMQEYYYAFLNPQQLLHWFYNYDDLIYFEYNDFHINVYETTQYVEGSTQCAFMMHSVDTTLQKTLSICEFLDLYGNI